MKLRFASICCFVLSFSLTAYSADLVSADADGTTTKRASVGTKASAGYQTRMLSTEQEKPISSVTDFSKSRRASMSTTSSLPPQPRFEERVWLDLAGVQFDLGKSLGISKDVIWIQTKQGAVIRKSLSELHPADRLHAQDKRQAILDYRRQKRELKL